MGLHDASNGAYGEVCLRKRKRVFVRNPKFNFFFGLNCFVSDDGYRHRVNASEAWHGWA